MGNIYILIGLIGSFLLGFLAGTFFGLGKFKRIHKEKEIDKAEKVAAKA